MDVVMIVDRSLRMKVDFNPSEEVLDHRFVVGSVRFKGCFASFSSMPTSVRNSETLAATASSPEAASSASRTVFDH